MPDAPYLELAWSIDGLVVFSEGRGVSSPTKVRNLTCYPGCKLLKRRMCSACRRQDRPTRMALVSCLAWCARTTCCRAPHAPPVALYVSLRNQSTLPANLGWTGGEGACLRSQPGRRASPSAAHGNCSTWGDAPAVGVLSCLAVAGGALVGPGLGGSQPHGVSAPEFWLISVSSAVTLG